MSQLDTEKAGPNIEHVEGETHDAEKTITGARLESEYVDLTKWQTVKKFRKATILSVMAMIGVLMDGFVTSLPGEPKVDLIRWESAAEVEAISCRTRDSYSNSERWCLRPARCRSIVATCLFGEVSSWLQR